jgi:hypothetical protein
MHNFVLPSDIWKTAHHDLKRLVKIGEKWVLKFWWVDRIAWTNKINMDHQMVLISLVDIEWIISMSTMSEWVIVV